MTPKEKAEELVDKMLFCYQGNIDKYTAKQCALIAVDEILDNLEDHTGKDIKFYNEVKNEIEKL